MEKNKRECDDDRVEVFFAGVGAVVFLAAFMWFVYSFSVVQASARDYENFKGEFHLCIIKAQAENEPKKGKFDMERLLDCLHYAG